MRKILWLLLALCLCGRPAGAVTLTVPLADGSTLTGDVVSFNENGIIFRLADDKYTDRLPWLKFSQAGLKQLAQNPKIQPFVAPFIEPPPAHPPKPPVHVNPPPRLAPPAPQSLPGALFSSPVTLLALLLIYAANLYAGYEVARYRVQPVPVVMGLSAVLPVAGPAIFLAMIPARVAAPVEETAPAAEAPAAPHSFTVPNTPPAASSPPPEEIHIVAASWQAAGSEAQPAETQVFQRGRFMFNRRFFETRFPGFFGSVRGDEDVGKTLLVKTSKGEIAVERILRVGANEAIFEAEFNNVRQEVIVPFADIQEVRLKPQKT